MKQLFIAYDGRAFFNIDEASVLVATGNEREAVQMAKDYEGVVFAYDEDETTNQLINERLVYPTSQNVRGKRGRKNEPRR